MISRTLLNHITRPWHCGLPCVEGGWGRRRLTADRSTISHSRNDLSYVTVQVVDAKGTPVPEAAVNVSFKIEAGPGEIAAVGSGDPRDTSSFYQAARRTWQGKALAIVRPTGSTAGSITLSATAAGLAKATATVTTATKD